ncbi:MAG: hypothetical protein O2985_03245 [Proteobacteria bacterium]|nr:hypothetical protein [Pseudomonadota bacterium]
MSALLVAPERHHHLPTLVDRAANALAGARTAAEVLEAREIATFAYDIAKRSARLNKAKNAHDDLIAAAHRAQANALEIEALAKHRLADEYDAAQERGEVAGNGQRGKAVPDENSFSPPTSVDLGLSRKEIYEARLVRDAEQADPGIIRRTLDKRIERGEEPSKAALRVMVVNAAMRGLRGGASKKSTRNPLYEPDPAFDASAGIDGCCTRIVELLDAHGAEFILSGCLDAPMLERSVVKMTRGRDALNTILEATHA